MEALLVATVDTAIAAEDMAVAAESLDLGICYIGGFAMTLRVSLNYSSCPPIPSHYLANGQDSEDQKSG